MTTDERELRDRIASRMSATRSKDVEAVLEHYARNVATFDVVLPLENHTAHAVRERLEQWLASFDGPLLYDFSDLVLRLSGDVAFDHHLTHVRGRTKTNGTIDMWFRETVGYERREGRWVVTHQHSSVPIDMTSGKGRMDLTPETA